MSKGSPKAQDRFDATHPVLKTRVPQEFYDRIKAEARARRVSLAKLLTGLFGDNQESLADLDSVKDQWRADGWTECAGWLLAKFRAQAFCDIDLNRLTQWLQSEPEAWPIVQQVAKRYQGEVEGPAVIESGEGR